MIALLAVAAFINYVDRGNLATAAPLLKSDLNLSNTEVGLLLSAFFWTYAPMQLLAGWMAERLDAQQPARDEAAAPGCGRRVSMPLVIRNQIRSCRSIIRRLIMISRRAYESAKSAQGSVNGLGTFAVYHSFCSHSRPRGVRGGAHDDHPNANPRVVRRTTR